MSVICSLFQIDWRNSVKTRLYLCRDYHLQPSEIDRMPYFEYEYLLDDVKEIQDKEKKEQEEQDKKYGNMDPGRYMRSMQQNIKPPSMPSMPKF